MIADCARAMPGAATMPAARAAIAVHRRAAWSLSVNVRVRIATAPPLGWFGSRRPPWSRRRRRAFQEADRPGIVDAYRRNTSDGGELPARERQPSRRRRRSRGAYAPIPWGIARGRAGAGVIARRA